MYKEIQDYFAKREQSELLGSCVEKIRYIGNGVELYCGSNGDNATLVLSIIEEGICDGELRELNKVTMECGKGLTTWVIVEKTEA